MSGGESGKPVPCCDLLSQLRLDIQRISSTWEEGKDILLQSLEKAQEEFTEGKSQDDAWKEMEVSRGKTGAKEHLSCDMAFKFVCVCLALRAERENEKLDSGKLL